MYPAFTAVCTEQRVVCLYRTVGYIAGMYDNGNSCYICETLPAVDSACGCCKNKELHGSAIIDSLCHNDIDGCSIMMRVVVVLKVHQFYVMQ